MINCVIGSMRCRSMMRVVAIRFIKQLFCKFQELFWVRGHLSDI